MEFDPYSHEYFNDPYPIYEYLRDEAPVYHNEKLGFYALSRFEDVLQASIDYNTYSSARGILIQDMDPDYLEAVPMMIMMDPPRQTRLRKLISKAFTPRKVAAMEPDVRALCVRILEPLVERGSCDFVKEFAAVLPMEIISTMLGVPEADRVQVRDWSDVSLTREPGNPEIPKDSMRAMGDMHAYFRELAAQRRKRPRDDMLSFLIQVEVPAEEGGTTKLTDREILGFASLVAGGGNETVTKLLGNALVLFHRNPGSRKRIAEDPRLIPGAVEEALRYWPPSQIQGRSLTRDVELHGRLMPCGSRVLLLTGAACRDGREYENPGRFDIDREIPIPLAFGHGAHKCLGAFLARLEGRVAFEELLERCPDFEVDEGNSERVHMTNVAGYASVPVTF
ncbi:MAG: cytochrome P450 [Myxococcota bacterium]|jgi:cytochrome P450|nr:cytochrome [Deltaproteobacteria bacterium]MCP4240704.1 cytochrome P450 [bacterium]MDP6243157.1 cytochrome P450 [Myxococcota bacterium]MDP7073095.1 cytochrome P450 [Myxococcota bacterium]MDP7299195.1 cytochrome P450 [Myxococcota bacterium]